MSSISSADAAADADAAASGLEPLSFWPNSGRLLPEGAIGARSLFCLNRSMIVCISDCSGPARLVSTIIEEDDEVEGADTVGIGRANGDSALPDAIVDAVAAPGSPPPTLATTSGVSREMTGAKLVVASKLYGLLRVRVRVLFLMTLPLARVFPLGPLILASPNECLPVLLEGDGIFTCPLEMVLVVCI